MKKFTIIAFFLIGIITVFSQCKKSERFKLVEMAISVPVEQMRAMPVGITKPITLKKPGKIYIYKDYLFINEPHKGIHIFDNSNPSEPKNISFLAIPGNIDLAVNSNILYADSYVDLLAFDISILSNIKQVKRVNDVFKQYYSSMYGAQKNVIIYKDSLIKIVDRDNELKMDAYTSSNSSGSVGQGGSMARFTLLNDHLYTVGSADLSLFNVKTPSNPMFIKSIDLGFGVETIFPYENKLFIGTNRGMHIFNAIDAGNPVKLSTYSHVFACDPVVVQGKYAYVTLRTGNFCRQATNQLEVVNIEDPTNPKQVAVYNMQNPHGLSVNENNLFVCEGDFGLKSFNITDKQKIDNNLLQHLKTIKSFDVIAGKKSLIVTGNDGIYQFTYTNPSAIKQLSKISLSESRLLGFGNN